MNRTNYINSFKNELIELLGEERFNTLSSKTLYFHIYKIKAVNDDFYKEKIKHLNELNNICFKKKYK
jgi:hypothetical protein